MDELNVYMLVIYYKLGILRLECMQQYMLDLKVYLKLCYSQYDAHTNFVGKFRNLL